MLETAAMNSAERAMHALTRLGFGPRSGDFEHVRAIGVEAWIHQQLRPESIAIPESLVERVHELSTLHMSPAALFLKYQRPLMMERRQNPHDKDDLKEFRQRRQVVVREAVEARLLRAIDGPRQLQEVMTAFWFNHFNVFAGKDLCEIWTGSFEERAIRPHTMGRFRDLLGATARHPAMLFYLDNWQNTAPGAPGTNKRFDGINENYARELMELHTLGVSGGYTQADVVALAHILTGWGLPKAGGGNGAGRGGMR
ncbi:MAG TPA: DUF1800 family protein, partial [Candidatus Binataceae bacterium]|nr:DUF1800 family protein [Candidatus Binataceae bacterium]